MSADKNSPKSDPTPTKKAVAEYLRDHPNFLKDHPELLTVLMPPENDYGDGVVDFQHFALGSLQKNMRALKGKYDGLVHSARDNMSVQSQVHHAALSLIKARGLEQLLQVLTIDLVSLFDVDVVKLALESEIAAAYDATYTEQNYSGLSFTEPGLTDAILGEAPFLLSDDTLKKPIPGFEQIFVDCSGLISSCALLRLNLEQTGRDAILAFGVRHKGRFHPGQGGDLLDFLARIIEFRLDQCLNDSELQKLI